MGELAYIANFTYTARILFLHSGRNLDMYYLYLEDMYDLNNGSYKKWYNKEKLRKNNDLVWKFDRN